jgi:hypothetical protein
MLTENITFNPNTLKTIVGDIELDFDVCEFIQTKSNYAEYLQFILKFGGYMFYQHLADFSKKSRSATFDDIKRMEELNLVIVKKANNCKYITLTRKALRFLKLSNKVSPKKDILRNNDSLMTTAYLADIYLKCKTYKNFLFLRERNSAIIYKAIIDRYKLNKENNTQLDFVEAFERKAESTVKARVFDKSVILSAREVSSNYILDNYVNFDRAYKIKTGRSFSIIQSGYKNDLQAFIRFTTLPGGNVKAEFTALEEVITSESSLKEYWEQQFILASRLDEQNPMIGKDILGSLVHSRIYIGHLEAIPEPVKITVNLFIIDLKRSETWFRQNLKKIDNIFSLLNQGLPRVIMDYKIVVACGSENRKASISKTFANMFENPIKNCQIPSEHKSIEQQITAKRKNVNNLIYLNDYTVENFSTERFLDFPSGNSKVPEGIKEGYINILEFRNKDISSNFSINASSNFNDNISLKE